jgi:uncharacterized membrane protein YeaQ/YmgE (transglycosylase-associated protein family)
MLLIIWIVLGIVLGLIASKIISTTGEGTVVDILLGIVGAVIGGWLFDLFDGRGLTGFNLQSVYSVGTAVIGAIIALALYHAFLRSRMLWSRRAGFPARTSPEELADAFTRDPVSLRAVGSRVAEILLSFWRLSGRSSTSGPPLEPPIRGGVEMHTNPR